MYEDYGFENENVLDWTFEENITVYKRLHVGTYKLSSQYVPGYSLSQEKDHSIVLALGLYLIRYMSQDKSPNFSNPKFSNSKTRDIEINELTFLFYNSRP